MKRAITSLLSLKEWDEERAKSAFADAFHALVREEEKLASLEEKFASAVKRLEETRGAVEGGEILVICEYLDFLTWKIEQQRGVVEEKKAELERARAVLLEATKERKIYERLLDKMRAAEKAAALKEEQSFLDDVAGKRWSGGGA